ncbi:MAG: hypothetical protein AAGG47_18215 [Pseudomonadota bacterium]
MTFAPSVAGPRVTIPETPAVFPNAARLNATRLDLRFAATLEPYSEDTLGTVTLRLADQGFCTEAGDTPAHTAFIGRLAEPIRWSRRTTSGTYAGRSVFRTASLRFSAVDRALPAGDLTYDLRGIFSRLALDGRDVEVRAVFDGYADGITIFRGTAENWARAGDGEVEVALRGLGYRLQTPLQPATYAGTGDLEGPADFEGLRKPVCFGRVFNIQPAPVIPGELVYQVHADAGGAGAQINAVTAVRIAGVPLTDAGDYPTVAALRAATAGSGGDQIPPGQYAACLAEGYVRLGAAPGGVLTCDVEGGVFEGAFQELPGTIMRIIATQYGPQLSASEVNAGTFRTIDGEAPWPVGIFLGPQSVATAESVLDEISAAVEGSYGDGADGRLEGFVIRAPGATAALRFSQAQVEERSFRYLPAPADLRPALREMTVGYGRNYTPTSDLPASVTGDDRTALEQEWRTTIGTQAVTRHAEAKTLRRDTVLSSKAGADGLRDALLALADGRSRRVSFTTNHKGLFAKPGQTVAVSELDEGLDDELVRVTGVSITGSTYRAEIEGIMRDG